MRLNLASRCSPQMASVVQARLLTEKPNADHLPNYAKTVTLEGTEFH